MRSDDGAHISQTKYARIWCKAAVDVLFSPRKWHQICASAASDWYACFLENARQRLRYHRSACESCCRFAPSEIDEEHLAGFFVSQQMSFDVFQSTH